MSQTPSFFSDFVVQLAYDKMQPFKSSVYTPTTTQQQPFDYND